jgi:GH25 family lysozyme M1 (1,4-beta-N-acetylmuramidase)
MAHGLDVFTAYQTVTDWRAVRAAGFEFCYVKVSDGTTIRDDGGYGSAARAAGVATGGYHYGQPGNAVAQANLLCDRVEAAHLTDLAPALDLESPFQPSGQAAQFAVAFLRQVTERGHRPCLYANNAMLSVILPAVRTAVPSVLVWAARYGANPTVDHDVWQYSDAGRVPGVRGTVDLNQGAIPFNMSAKDDDMDGEQDNRLKLIEQNVRSILRELTGDPQGNPTLDLTWKPVAGKTPGWPLHATAPGPTDESKTVTAMIQGIYESLRAFEASHITGDTNKTTMHDLAFDSAKWTFEDKAVLAELVTKLDAVLAHLGT